MRKIYLSSYRFILASCLATVLAGTAVYAQAPDAINYQAVARNVTTGGELSNTPLFVLAKMRRGGPTGAIVYQEDHSEIVTNSFGIFHLQIGQGSVTSGDFKNIDWANGPYWLDIELDAGAGLENAGSMQLVSVPYALHAGTVDNVNDADADPDNELITDFYVVPDGNVIILKEGGQTFPLTLPSKDDADADPTNEFVQSLSLDENNVLHLIQGTNVITANLSNLAGQNGADNDPQNELVTDFFIADGKLKLLQSGAGANFEVLLNEFSTGQVDEDADPNNEIQDLVFSGDNLSISGGTTTINLADYRNDADADPNNEIQDLVYSGDNLSISGGTTTINLASYRNDADADPNNEIQDLVYSGDNLSISGGTTTINLADYRNDADADPNNEIQDLVYSGDNLSISGGTTTINLADYRNDADADPNNEIQDLVYSGDNLSISGGTTTINLADYRNDADANIGNEHVSNFHVSGGMLRLTQFGGGSTYEVPLTSLNSGDADADPQNELQTLAQVLNYDGPSNSLDGQDAGGNVIRNIGEPVNLSDAASKKYVDERPLSGDVSGTANNTIVTGLQGINVANNTPSNGMILKYNALQNRWEPATNTAAAGGGIYAIDPLDFVEYRKVGELKNPNAVIHEDDPSFVTIHKEDEGRQMGAAVHLPHDVLVTDLKIFYKVKKSGSRELRIRLQRKEFSTGQITDIYSQIFTASNNNDDLKEFYTDLNSLPVNERLIDNGHYSYRLFAEYNTNQDFNNVEESIIQMHGAVIRYQ